MIDFIEIINFKNARRMEGVCSLITLHSKIDDVRKQELAKLPYHINLLSITSGKVKEIHHSCILHKLLNKQEILDTFVSKLLHIQDIEFKIKEIRDPDKDRMDLSIYGKKKAIIIENKINNAPEMPGQIFRYVKKAHKDKYAYEDIIVVYLNSNHKYSPTSKSLSERGEGINFIPDIVRENMIVLDYSHDVYGWLKTELENIDLQNEKHLWTSIFQYCDYLEETYYKSKRYNKMKEEIRKKLDLEILNGLSNENDPHFNSRIEKLDQLEEDLSALLDDVNEYRQALANQRDKIIIEEALAQKGLNLLPLNDIIYEENTYGIEFSKNGKKGYIAFGLGDEPYIGIATNEMASISDTDKKQLSDFFSATGLDSNEEQPIWIAWNYVRDYNNLSKEFISLVNIMLDKSQKASYKLEIKDDSN